MGIAVLVNNPKRTTARRFRAQPERKDSGETPYKARSGLVNRTNELEAEAEKVSNFDRRSDVVSCL